ncbi:MAG: general secretion pathway protein GspB [Deltaproteobacteria bacterium]|nr:general secretion pathway protein GspB [Deltaproteobacteria bacterium]
MSFILDALKRAERDRRLERPPDLTAVYEEDHLPQRGIRPWLWIVGIFLVSAIVVGLILWPDGPDPPPPVVPTEASIARAASETAPPPAKIDAPASPASPERSVPSPPGPSPAPKQEAPPAPPPKTADDTGAKALPETGSKPAGETPDVKPPPSDEGTPPAPAPSVPSTREIEPVEPAAPQTEADPDSPPPPLPADLQTEASPVKPASIPLLSELPFEVREKVGELQINVHSYSENPAERLVFINMKSFKAGDQLKENGPILKEITQEGVIIDYGEGQARVQVWR